MRMLVLGGTVFLGRTVAEEGVRRGHEVVCAARGESGTVPDGARLVRVDRNAEDALAALAGERFDAVVDVATMSYRWVSEALRALADRSGHWTFVSSINVYADTETVGQTTDAPLLDPVTAEADRPTPEVDPHLYGGIKVASENAVREATGERALVVRAGLIVGPGDRYDRFGYWPARFSRGGRVAVPDVPKQPFQYVDVRDLAAWIVSASEQRLPGTFDGAGPARPLLDVLRDIADAVGAPGTELVPVPVETLLEAGVTPWAGPRSLPLWAPSTHHGFVAHDTTATLAAGLRPRPLAEVARDALGYERSLGLDRERRAGLTPAGEADLLARL
ncbi:NAD-dependent epimerase/dehydratase family protein [Gandjariella thermophila]|uniref:Reductase n=1 Tax=Gandjariella thermophila TaxID=1931992 RepID=A0A4D4JCN2_9PSEU|nr:NAD-dependent epimerase/dehydratase family protein [Gandjariella thermophila]GDY32129.1 reductase [Gandjariella thermophila]